MDQQQIEMKVKEAFWTLLGKKEFLQPKGLIKRLAQTACLDELPVRGALAELARQGWVGGVNGNGLPYGKVTPNDERPAEPESPSLIKWRNSLKVSGICEDDGNALLPLHERLGDISEEDQIVLVQGLLKLRECQAKHYGEPSFMVSAAYLMGSSKLLDSLPSASIRTFGIQIDKFSKGPQVLLIAGPPAPANVVLIENPHSFWRAISSPAIEKTAFIVTFGYGLSKHGDGFGNQMASILEEQTSIIGAVCAGSPPPVMELLQHQHIFFWGDLDVEGLKIYERIKKVIPLLKLSALYRPMLEAVKNPANSHSYVEAAMKHKQVVKFPDEKIEASYTLTEACLVRAVDQEIVTYEEITIYATKNL